jgi:hypothetical protein
LREEKKSLIDGKGLSPLAKQAKDPSEMNIPTASQIANWLDEDRRQKQQDSVFADRLAAHASSQTKWAQYFEALKNGLGESEARKVLQAH